MDYYVKNSTRLYPLSCHNEVDAIREVIETHADLSSVSLYSSEEGFIDSRTEPGDLIPVVMWPDAA
jgi:hypothetical protein